MQTAYSYVVNTKVEGWCPMPRLLFEFEEQVSYEGGMVEGTEDERYRAPALDKGLDILELLAGIDGGITQAEIAKHLGRSPNEFYRMLDRLVRRGYVTRIDGDRYSLTLKLFGLAQLHAPVRRLVSYATPIMRELAEQTSQANHLVVFDRGSCVVIAQQEAPGYWGISIRVGSHIPLFDTGSGHVLMAFRSEEERRMMIREYLASNDTPDFDTGFFDRMDEIRARGYERMPSAQTAGVFNLVAPVLGPDGTAIAALAVPFIGLVNAAEAHGIDATLSAVRTAANRLSELAGATP